MIRRDLEVSRSVEMVMAMLGRRDRYMRRIRGKRTLRKCHRRRTA